MRPVTRQYTDVETGQVMTLQTEEPIPNRRRPVEGVDEDFVMLFSRGILAYIQHLPGQRMALLLLLLDAMDPRTGESRYSLADLARKLDTPDTYVSKMIRELADVDVLRRIKRGIVAVNPRLGWRGSLSRRRTLLRERGN